MANWNGVPIDSPQIKIPNSIPQTFNWNSYVSDPSGTFNKFKGARETHRLNWKGYRTAAANTKKAILSSPSKKTINAAMQQVRSLRKAKKIANQAKKIADNSKKVQDAFFEKMPGGATAKNGKIAGGHLLNIVLQGGLALAIINNILIQNGINDAVDRQLLRIGLDGSKVLTSLGTLYSRVKNLDAKVGNLNNKITRELDTNAKDYARLNKQTETIGQQVVTAKKQANDALYETREGRKIVTGLAESARKLANDTLYEFRQNKITVEAKITEQRIGFDAKIQSINNQISKINNTASDAFQKTVNTTISKLQLDLAAARSQIAAIKPATPVDTASITANAVAAAKSEVNGLKGIISGLTAQINAAIQLGSTAISGVSNLSQGVSSANTTASQALNEVKSSAARNLGTMQQQLDAKFNEVVAQNLKDLKIRDLSQSNLSKEFDQKLADFERLNKLTGDERYQALIEDNRKTLATTDLKLSKLSQEFDKRNAEFFAQSTKTSQEIYDDFVEQNKASLATIKSEITLVKTDIKTNEADIAKIDTKLREQEKVNGLALPKLDQILGILPLIPARVADTVRPDIPTLPQIENATGTAMCRSMNGGCSGRRLDEVANNINANTNNRIGNALDVVNTGANAALLVGQQTILGRLGEQLPGGIGGKLSRFADWMHLDRVLNILILAATIHNGLMLSNDIGQTLIGAINNVLQLIGLKKEDGSAFDIGSVISGSIENLIKGTIGADNYIELKEAWAKANRIYQATNNVINSFLNLSQTILQASELIAAYTGRIGNALRKGGVILESAYGWMNPQPKFNRVTGFLEKLQNGASTIQMVTQAPLDIVNATTELTTASTDFVKAIKEDDKPENKPAPTPEPDGLKVKEQTSKVDSQPLNFDFSDLFDGED